MNRKLFLHVGTQKTGSSFLQHMLRTNASRLQDRGVAYRRFSSEYVSSGNGDDLIRAVQASPGAEDFCKTLQGYFIGSNAAIISSELLYTTDLLPDGLGWRYLFERFRECGIQLEVIAFFRNPVDYLRSAYSQSVKRHGFTGDFSQYVEDFSPALYDGPLRQIVAESETLGSGARLRVVAYDCAKSAGLWPAFLGLCGLDGAGLVHEQVRVNASLNAGQLLLHRIYNKIRPDDTSEFFSRLLLENAVMADAEPLGVTEAQFEAIRAKFAPAVQYVNRFVAGEAVRISPPQFFSEGGGELVMHGDDIARLMQPMFSANFANRVLAQSLSVIIHQCKHADPELKRRYPDFDPVSYMVCNPDLVQAKVDPYWHFDNYGRLEGRRHKIGD